MNQENPNELEISNAMTTNQSASAQSTDGALLNTASDYIPVGNIDVASTLASNTLPIATVNEALYIRDLISDHPPSEAAGGYLHFTNDNDVVTLAIDFCDRSGSGNPTYVSLATLEGVSGLSTSEIMNVLLANHEIKFG